MSVHLLNDLSFLTGGVTKEDVDNVKINAQSGDPLAQYHLALMFDIGRGVERNPREAEKWYRKAAEQGHVNAQYYLARMYSIETSGIDKNVDEALTWYQKAAKQGHPDAKEKITYFSN